MKRKHPRQHKIAGLFGRVPSIIAMRLDANHSGYSYSDEELHELRELMKQIDALDDECIEYIVHTFTSEFTD